MFILGFALYPIMAIILWVMWRRVQGMTLEQILAKAAAEHHQLNEIFKAYPQGGDFREMERWTRDP